MIRIQFSLTIVRFIMAFDMLFDFVSKYNAVVIT
jgi:hypothetical protein